MIHRATLVPLSILGLENLCEQRHTLVGTREDDLIQLILTQENGPNKRCPIWLLPDHPSPPGATQNTGICAIWLGY
jgi:hypothetical protein